jgi:hypothetical protein
MCLIVCFQRIQPVTGWHQKWPKRAGYKLVFGSWITELADWKKGDSWNIPSSESL